MVDAKKAAEALKKLQVIQRTIATHESNIARIEREKGDRVRYYDQQIKTEQDRIRSYARQVEDLKRQI